MVANVARFYDLLNGFQDAAFEPGTWPSLLTEVAVASGAGGINVMSMTARGHVSGVFFTDSLSAIMEAYIDEGWYARDHRAKFTPLMKRSGVVFETDFIREEEFGELEYYKFMARYGFQHTAVINFFSGSEDRFFVLQRKHGDGGFENEDRVHLAALRSQLQASSRVMALFSMGDMAGRLSAFERANVAGVFFDQQGYVVAQNAKADLLLTGDVRISHKKLRASTSRETAMFDTMLSKVIHSKDIAQGEVVTLTRREKRPLLVRIERAGPNLRDIFAKSYAMALFEDLGETPLISYEALQRMFGLTPAEYKIALVLTEGVDVRTIAEHAGIRYETARTHIRSILKKTGTQRQAELCLLLAGIRLG